MNIMKLIVDLIIIINLVNINVFIGFQCFFFVKINSLTVVHYRVLVGFNRVPEVVPKSLLKRGRQICPRPLFDDGLQF